MDATPNLFSSYCDRYAKVQAQTSALLTAMQAMPRPDAVNTANPDLRDQISQMSDLIDVLDDALTMANDLAGIDQSGRWASYTREATEYALYNRT